MRNEGERPPMKPKEFMATLCAMKEIIEDLCQRVRKATKVEHSVHVEGGGEGGVSLGPSSPPPSSSSNYDDDSSKHSSKDKHTKKIALKKPLLKLYVNFDLPMYNGEPNADKLNNLIRQIESCCRVQQIYEDKVNI